MFSNSVNFDTWQSVTCWEDLQYIWAYIRKRKKMFKSSKTKTQVKRWNKIHSPKKCLYKAKACFLSLPFFLFFFFLSLSFHPPFLPPIYVFLFLSFFLDSCFLSFSFFLMLHSMRSLVLRMWTVYISNSEIKVDNLYFSV